MNKTSRSRPDVMHKHKEVFDITMTEVHVEKTMHDPELEVFLAHYGVKGMKWGVRKARDKTSASTSSDVDSKAAKTSARRERAKKVAIGTGLLIAAAGTAYVGYKLHEGGHLSVSKLPQAKPEVKKKVESIMTEPSDLIYASRMRDKGFSFVRKGNLPDPLPEYDRAFGANSGERNVFKRYGDNNEKIAVSFDDPDGRMDRAGRIIPHEVVIPRTMAEGINTHAEAVSKAWSIVGPKFATDYDNEIDPVTGRKHPDWRT